MKKLLIIILSLLFTETITAQVYPLLLFAAGAAASQEHGFLPGKKFKFYPTIGSYDFKGLRIRAEVYDDREIVKLKKVNCSDIEFTNTSEFDNPACIYKVGQYLDSLFTKTGAVLDETSSDTLQVRLEGIDARLIGAISIRAHGLCQVKIKYHTIEKTYCIDITDADPHSPIGPKALVTRKTATRIIASAAIREVIEQFFIDLKSYR